MWRECRCSHPTTGGRNFRRYAGMEQQPTVQVCIQEGSAGPRDSQEARSIAACTAGLLAVAHSCSDRRHTTASRGRHASARCVATASAHDPTQTQASSAVAIAVAIAAGHTHDARADDAREQQRRSQEASGAVASASHRVGLHGAIRPQHDARAPSDCDAHAGGGRHLDANASVPRTPGTNGSGNRVTSSRCWRWRWRWTYAASRWCTESLRSRPARHDASRAVGRLQGSSGLHGGRNDGAGRRSHRRRRSRRTAQQPGTRIRLPQVQDLHHTIGLAAWQQQRRPQQQQQQRHGRARHAGRHGRTWHRLAQLGRRGSAAR